MSAYIHTADCSTAEPCPRCFEFGVTTERERIIALLDDWRCGHPDCDGDKTEVCYPKHYLIARINGEAVTE